MVRHMMNPQITGLAQVNGYQGGDDLPSMTKRVDLDLTHLSQWSIRMDFLIMLKTAILFERIVAPTSGHHWPQTESRVARMMQIFTSSSQAAEDAALT